MPLPSTSNVKDRPQTATAALRTVLLTGNDIEAKRQEILAYFHATFSQYESIFECLNGDEAFYARANALRHPLIFYYGHTSVFFINKMNVAKLINERVDPKTESTLAIGVDEMSWDDLNEAHYEWPSVASVKWHRDGTRKIVDHFIRDCKFSLPITWDSPMWVVLMGIEHERIHLETTSVLIRELPLAMVKRHPFWSNICPNSGTAPHNQLLSVEGGSINLGKEKTDRLYGWDNEYGSFETKIAPFKASQYLVSNQEFLEFINDKGYRTKSYWTEEGWQWVQYRKAEHPVFWVKDKGDNDNHTASDTTNHDANGNIDYHYRTMLDIIAMPWDWPVDINYLEAKAFCNWKSHKTGKSIRMPTEAEWTKLRQLIGTDLPDWEQAPGNINLESYTSSCPVTHHRVNGSDSFHDIIGNVWQWSETPISGFDGFSVHPAYDDFSTPTFDGKHNLIKGGSWASTGNYAIKDSRYAFRRHFFQHAGLRYVEAGPMPELKINIYETDQSVSQYIEFHYGDTYLNVPNFPVACVAAITEHLKGRSLSRALDIGCATGRSSFELAKHFDHVDALDFSARLIEVPTNLQNTGSQRYVIINEGDLVSYRDIKLADFNGYQVSKDKITFSQGDASNLIAKFTDYDLVFAGNLIDRLYDPARFLELIKDRIRPGGLLVLTSPYTWLKEFTDRDRWLGGFKADTGENYTTLDGLRDALAPHFSLLDEPRDIPFVIRETARKYQHTLAQMSIWVKQKG